MKIKPRRLPLPHTLRGLGLVEIMIGVAVIGVLAAVAMPAMSDFLERRRVVAVTGELMSILAYAKSETNVVGAGLNLHLEDDPDNAMSCAAVVTQTLGDDCKCYRPAGSICPTSGTLLRLFQLPRSDSVGFTATASAWGALNQVATFNRKTHQQVEQNFRLTVTGLRTGVTLRIDMNEAGRITVCSPVGRLGGYPTCS